jgi:hypothetical protein
MFGLNLSPKTLADLNLGPEDILLMVRGNSGVSVSEIVADTYTLLQ